MAQLPSLSGDQPESGWCGPEDTQELLRHANSRITLDIYTRAISETKRDANNKVIEMVIEAGKAKISAPSPAPSQREPLMLEDSKKGAGNSQHPSAPSRGKTHIVTVPQTLAFLEFMAGTTGLEPATSAVTAVAESSSVPREAVPWGYFSFVERSPPKMEASVPLCSDPISEQRELTVRFYDEGPSSRRLLFEPRTKNQGRSSAIDCGHFVEWSGDQFLCELFIERRRGRQ
jgi:hypothetical protein